MPFKSVQAYLTEISNVDEIVHYDFKHERGIYKSVDNIELWLEYRNDGSKWDCDGSGRNSKYTCKLTRDIYKVLWGWDSEKESWFKNTAKFNNLQMSPDTMNSYFNILTQTIEVVDPIGKREYFKCIKNKKHWSNLDTSKEGFLHLVAKVREHKEIGPLLVEYARLTHTIGNFVLVPKCFNAGRVNKTSDYWDVSLRLLQLDKNWLKGESFKEYVNTFFLWDYVDENYEVKSFFAGHCFENIKPNTTEECVELLQTIMNAIVRRGYFMVAMLKVATKYPDKYNQILKEITKLEKASMESAVRIMKESTNEDNEISDI